MMRRMLLPILLPLALMIWAAPAGAAHRDTKASSKRRCLPSHAIAVSADSRAALYLAPEDPQNPEFLDVYGCSYKTKRTYLLGSVPSTAGGYESGDGGEVMLETLAGTMAAYETGLCGPETAGSVIVVRDLYDGKVVHCVPTGTPAHPEPPRTEHGLTVTHVGIGPVESLVVKSDGAVAWIAQDAVEESLSYSYQVHVLDKNGSRVLAASTEIEPKSLALAGSVLYWTEAGRPMSAVLH